MKSTGAIAVMMLLGVCLSGCSSSGQLGPKASPEKAAQTNVQLAIEYMKLNKLSSSRDFIERALKEDPGNANVEFTAGLVYERLKETRKAERAYSSAARIGKNDPNIQNGYAGFLCRTGKTAAGEKLFDEVARDPLYQTPEVALVNAGVCVRSTGDMVDAKRYFNRALALRPNLPEALLELGNLALDQGEAAEALDYVTRYLAVNQPTPDVLWLGYRTQRKLGDNTAAAAYARRIQAEFPNSEQALLMRSGDDR
jgi:type IV pilus assembly protein PilF